MKKFDLKSMQKGWFVGNFDPVVYKTSECEVAVKNYKRGDEEPSHFHELAEEITIVISGKIQLNDLQLKEGEIVLVQRKEVIKFKALEDSVTVVFKSGSFKDDKYLINPNKND